MSAKGDTTWVDRSPKQSKAMKAAYAGLAEAERYLGECHDAEDWEAHREAIAISRSWYQEISRIALAEVRSSDVYEVQE
jgi:hypothetical protein